jgi:hypothetical protein
MNILPHGHGWELLMDENFGQKLLLNENLGWKMIMGETYGWKTEIEIGWQRFWLVNFGNMFNINLGSYAWSSKLGNI